MLVLFTGLAESRQSAILNHDALIILEPTPFELWGQSATFFNTRIRITIEIAMTDSTHGLSASQSQPLETWRLPRRNGGHLSLSINELKKFCVLYV